MKKISNLDIKKLETLYNQNKLNELEEESKKLLKIEENNIILLNILGVTYLKKRNFVDAETVFKKILNNNSNNENALKNLARTYKKINKISHAIKYYESYLEVKPNDSEILNSLASCYVKNKKSSLALNCYKKLLKKNPENDVYLINYAVALFETLNFNEAVKILENLLDKNINNKVAFSKYLFNQNYNPKINYDKINTYIKKFYHINKKENLNIINFCFEKNPKKINVGFVSPDFRNHPLGYAALNLIKCLKIYNLNLFAYYNFNIEDNLTEEFKKNFNYFYNIEKLNDEQTINKIRSDGIHILIDLAGYTLNNRLSIFSHNPAPIQASWLGYLPTTGLKEITYKIGDPNIYSKEIEKNFSEKILRLPNIWSDFTMPVNIIKEKPNFNEIENEIIFGSFVTLRKINEKVISLWSKVLKKFSNTKIYLKSPELHDTEIKKKLENEFFNHGVNSNKLILEESSDYKTYLKSYSKVHITLDPFPWNGVTTSFESVWMGVPVFCLKGDSPYSRCSYSINKNLKMDDWIAIDENDYLTKLETILSNKKKLLQTKKNLRDTALKNNLFNSKEFARNFCEMLNETWKNFEKK